MFMRIYENINDYNPIRKRRKLIVFDDMIADIMSNKNFKSSSKNYLLDAKKLNISLAFITQSYFSVPKHVRLNTTYYFIMKINNKIELQIIATNHSADIDYQDFKKMYKECTKKPFNFLTIDNTLPPSDPLRFRKYLFDSYKNDNN